MAIESHSIHERHGMLRIQLLAGFALLLAAIHSEAAGFRLIDVPADSDNPALSPFLNTFAPWKHDFTVVNWDQRGAGKTFEKLGEATPDLTLHCLTDDAVEVTRYALNRLGKRKL